MTDDSRAGSFRISEVALASSTEPAEEELDETAPLPPDYGRPLLFGIARNPRIMLVCWNVDWSAAFGDNLPADRKGHVKLKSGALERIEAVEPLSGTCSIAELTPGEAYEVELGYFAPANQWNVIATAPKVTMPSENAIPGEHASVEVAIVPFHLGFQELAGLFGSENRSDVMRALAKFEQSLAQKSVYDERDEQILRALGLSAADLQMAAATRDALTQVTSRLSAARAGFSSWVGSGS